MGMGVLSKLLDWEGAMLALDLAWITSILGY